MFISSVKAATYYAEMPPYEDKWTLSSMGPPSDDPGVGDADGNLDTGKMTVYADWTGIWEIGDAFGHVKMWKRVWLPAGTIYLDCSWHLKGHYFSKFFTIIRIHLYIFIEESLNTGTIWEEDLYYFHKDDAYYFAEDVDETSPPKSYPATISEAGYYNVGEGLFGSVCGLDGLIDFDSEEGGDEGGWVSIKLRNPELSISAATGGTTSPAPGTYSYDHGSSVTVTATAYSDYTFDGWRLNGVYAGNDNPITVTMDSDHTLAASFDQVPNTPSQPSGPTYGYVETSYSYSTSTTDPDGVGVQYDFDWGDDSTTRTGWYPSGTTVSASHTWSSPGTYDVKVKARDGFGGESNWSPILTVNIVNRAPNTPSRPSGSTSGYLGTYYYYLTSTTDPDGDDVKYKFDWGDYSYTTTGYYSSGATVRAGHKWSTTGYKSVRVKACDVHGEWSGWSSSLQVYIREGGSGGCPILYVYDGSEYVEEGLLDIHNPEGVDVVYEHTLVTTPQCVDGAYLLRLTEHPKTHSYIDQVKLYAMLEDGTLKELPLIWAWHSEDGNVLPQLLHSVEWKADTLGADLNDGTSQSIDLKFAALSPNLEIAGFMFQIEGNNMLIK